MLLLNISMSILYNLIKIKIKMFIDIILKKALCYDSRQSSYFWSFDGATKLPTNT